MPTQDPFDDIVKGYDSQLSPPKVKPAKQAKAPSFDDLVKEYDGQSTTPKRQKAHSTIPPGPRYYHPPDGQHRGYTTNYPDPPSGFQSPVSMDFRAPTDAQKMVSRALAPAAKPVPQVKPKNAFQSPQVRKPILEQVQDSQSAEMKQPDTRTQREKILTPGPQAQRIEPPTEQPNWAQDKIARFGRGAVGTIPGAISGTAKLADAMYGGLQRMTGNRLPEAADWSPVVSPPMESAQKGIEDTLPIDPARNQDWSSKIASGLGSAAGFGKIGAATRALGLPFKVGIGAAGVGLGANEIADEMKEAGFVRELDPARYDRAIMLGGATGLSELIGLGKTLEHWGLKRAVLQRGIEVLENSGQEAFQKWMANVNAANVGQYDQSRPWSKDVLESAILGGIVSGGVQAADVASQRMQPATVPEQIANRTLANQNAAVQAERAPLPDIRPSTIGPTNVLPLTPRATKDFALKYNNGVFDIIEHRPLEQVSPQNVKALQDMLRGFQAKPDAPPEMARAAGVALQNLNLRLSTRTAAAAQPATPTSAIDPDSTLKDTLGPQPATVAAESQPSALFPDAAPIVKGGAVDRSMYPPGDMGDLMHFVASAEAAKKAPVSKDSPESAMNKAFESASILAADTDPTNRKQGERGLRNVLGQITRSPQYAAEVKAAQSGQSEATPYLNARNAIEQKLKQASEESRIAELEKLNQKLAPRVQFEEEGQSLRRQKIQQQQAEREAARQRTLQDRAAVADIRTGARAEIRGVRQEQAIARDQEKQQIAEQAKQQKNRAILKLRDDADAAEAAADKHSANRDHTETLRSLASAKKSLQDLQREVRPVNTGAVALRKSLHQRVVDLDTRIRETKAAQRQDARAGVKPTKPLSAPLLRPEAVQNPEGGIPEMPEQTFSGRLNRGIEEQRAQKPAKPAKRIIDRIKELGGVSNRYAGELQSVKDARRIGIVRNRPTSSPDILARQLAEDGYDVDPDNLDTLWAAIDRDVSGQERVMNTGEIGRRLEAEEAEYNAKQEENQPAVRLNKTSRPELGRAIYTTTNEEVARGYAGGGGAIGLSNRARSGDETVSKFGIKEDAKIFSQDDSRFEDFDDLMTLPEFKEVWESNYPNAQPTNKNVWDAAQEARVDLQDILEKKGYQGARHRTYTDESGGEHWDYGVWDESILGKDGGVTVYRGGRRQPTKSFDEIAAEVESDTGALQRAIARSEKENPRPAGEITRPGQPQGVSFSPYADMVARNSEAVDRLFDVGPETTEGRQIVSSLRDFANKNGIESRHVGNLLNAVRNHQMEKAFWQDQGLSLETVQQSTDGLDADMDSTRQKIAALPDNVRSEVEREVAALDALFDDTGAVNLLERAANGEDNAINEFKRTAEEFGLSGETVADLIEARRPTEGVNQRRSRQDAQSQSSARNTQTRTEPRSATPEEFDLLIVNPATIPTSEFDDHVRAVEKLRNDEIRGIVKLPRDDKRALIQHQISLNEERKFRVQRKELPAKFEKLPVPTMEERRERWAKELGAKPSEIKAREQKGRASFGKLQREPTGEVLGVGLGGLQKMLGRKAKAPKTPTQYPIPKGFDFTRWSQKTLNDALVAALPKRAKEQYKKATTAADKKKILAQSQLDPKAAKEILDLMKKVQAAVQSGDGGAVYDAIADGRKFLIPPRTKFETIKVTTADALNLPRAVMASMDISAPLRQGAILTLPPTQWGKAAKASITMFEALVANKSRYRDIQKRINLHKDADVAKDAGLYLSTDETGLRQTEEDFISGWSNHIPLIKQSEQAYKAYLDTLRIETFARYKKSIDKGRLTTEQKEEAYEAAAKWINTATGRGTLGQAFESAVPVLSKVLFAPRYAASRFQVLNPYTYGRNLTTPAGRAVLKNQMSDLIQFGGMVATTLALAAAAGATIGDDPDDPDFLKIKVGNTRYDFLAGLQQPMRLFWRMGKELKNKATGQKSEGRQDALDIAGRYGRSKLAPVPSFFVDYITGKDFIGRDFDAKRGVVDRVVPLIWRDFYEAYQKEGIGGAAMILPGLAGIGVQNYGERTGALKGSRFTAEAEKSGLKYDYVRQKKGEPEAVYKQRVERVEKWMDEYGGKLIAHPRYKALSPEDQKAAVENLRRRIGAQQNLKVPKTASFAPSAVLLGVKKSAAQRPARERKKLWVSP